MESDLDILARRRHGFGIYWLAATLGSRGGVASKKLTRKEVMSCNLVTACEKLAAPDEPLALRLQSNLLCGIARVYQQQWTIHSAEVAHLHQHLRKALSEALKRDTEAVDRQLAPPPVPTHIARNQITLGLDPALAVLGWDAEYEQMVDWSETAAIVDIGEKIEELSSGVQIEKAAGAFLQSLYRFAAAISNIHGDAADLLPNGDQTVAPLKAPDVSQITLREPHLEQYRAGEEPAYGFDEGLGAAFEFGEGELASSAIRTSGCDGYGLLEGQFPELDEQIRAASLRSRSAAPSLREAERTSSVGGILPEVEDMGGFEHDFALEFGGEGYVAPAVPEALPGIERAPSLPAPEEPAPQPEEEEAVARAAQVARRAAKKHKVCTKFLNRPHSRNAHRHIRQQRGVIDSSTALDDNTIRDMRTSYTERMEEERARAEEQRGAREAIKAGMDAIFRPPPGCKLSDDTSATVALTHQAYTVEGGPLGDLWHSTVTERLVPLGGGQARVDRQARVAVAPPAVEEARAAEARMRGLSVEVGRPIDRGFSPALEFGGEGYMGPEFEGMGGLDLAAEYFPEPELGRPASRPESLVPWHAEDVTSDVGAAEFERAPSVLGRVSLETPVRARTRTASLLGRSRAPSVLEPEAAEVAKSKTTASDLGVPQELESLKFLAYARRVQTTVAEEDGKFLFSDLVPAADSTKSVAAMGFYHLLVLATRDEIEIGQPEAYGGVRVAFSAVGG
ncbi:BQ2448_1581 [Microbotryum intermedium]|uniref:BQ2448_1581 protein n=1 Tax=Microbotryum intermedium TaxID=269621 RepID=A0A238FAI9_9BASI|nr:BQ2448_1581 [Microbotryum intermedium]